MQHDGKAHIAGTPAGRHALDLTKGRILMDLGDREQALTFLRNAAPPLHGDADAAAHYAAVMSSLGLRDIAIEQYQSDLASRDPESARRLLPALYGGNDSAFFWWQYLRHARGPNDPARIFSQLSNVLSHKTPSLEFDQLVHDAIKWIDHTARPLRECATDFVHLADATAGHGRTDLARDLFIKATRLPLDPPTPSWAGARNLARIASPALPTHPPAQCVAWLRLGDLAASAGDWPLTAQPSLASYSNGRGGDVTNPAASGCAGLIR